MRQPNYSYFFGVEKMKSMLDFRKTDFKIDFLPKKNVFNFTL